MSDVNTQQENVSDTSIENRSAFRIDDNILLSLRIIPDDQIQELLKKYPENNAELQLLNNFSDSSKALTDQFALVRRRYPEVAKYLKILDDKINTLARRQFSACSMIPDLNWREVNISASGIRFNYDKKLNLGSYLELRLQLSQISNYILSYGKIVRSTRAEEAENQFTIGVEFTHMNAEDREAIHTHVRGKEIKLIRDRNFT
ncbi:MAG: PilZ domain-containing protein [Gammaproteobacteria bacterium]|nr:PilZ domain-containing protein [Gammaproteobacteria bacterium]